MDNAYIYHHGIKGQQWGITNGPPYPLDSSVSTGKQLKKQVLRQQKEIKKSAKKQLTKDREVLYIKSGATTTETLAMVAGFLAGPIANVSINMIAQRQAAKYIEKNPNDQAAKAFANSAAKYSEAYDFTKKFKNLDYSDVDKAIKVANKTFSEEKTSFNKIDKLTKNNTKSLYDKVGDFTMYML